MNITYYIQHCVSKKLEHTVQTTSSLKKAKEYFEYYCQLNPKEKYKIVRSEIINEIIAESTDYRQKTFEFI